ncbi:TlpA disulfide reductase family protein [Kordiimonas sp.]|uniref:TlpA disulfide reductase family protein n=1 Tax=Kordiimonas sp. TaxID=1970157 RepID=UPI003A94628C
MRKLIGFSLVLLASLSASNAFAADVDDYLVGDLSGLNVKAGEVQVADMKVVSDFNGTKKTVETLGEKAGKALIVTFYGRECLGCRAHLRSLAALQREMGDDRMEIVALSLDEGNIHQAKRTLDRWGIEGLAPYTPYHLSILRDLTMDPDFRRNGTGPASVIIGPDGLIKATSYRLRHWEAPETIAFFDALADGKI